MKVLLDTNVLSEVRRPAPSRRVLYWIDGLDEDRTFISVISIAQIRRGLCLLEPGRKRSDLSEWLAKDLPHRFERRIIDIDTTIALAWGDVMGVARQRGVTLSAREGWLAAMALAHDLVLATRNIKDFQDLGVRLIDPWKG